MRSWVFGWTLVRPGHRIFVFLCRGLCLSSAVRSRSAAHWASWACMRMVRQRHPDIAEFMMTNLADGAGPCFVSVRGCQQSLVEAGLEMPSWAELSESLVLEENSEPNQPKVGWQRKAVRSGVTKVHPRRGVANVGRATTRFVLRSQRGPLASASRPPE